MFIAWLASAHEGRKLAIRHIYVATDYRHFYLDDSGSNASSTFIP